MTVVTVGRLSLGLPSSYPQEPVGDPVGSTGSAVVPAARSAQQVVVDLNTILSGASTLANAQTIRRQLRSMLNNGPLKMQAFLYLIYTDDMEQNGWLVPTPATITSPDNMAWKAGVWEVTGQWYLAGRQRGMREARAVWMKDLRTGLFERDALQWIVGTAGENQVPFTNLQALMLTILPNGAAQVENTVSGQVPTLAAVPAGRDGGVCELVASSALGTNIFNPDLAFLSYERAESALNLSDVIMYDRRGQITAPSTGPDTSWEEFYGEDYPYNWMNAGGANDCPVLDNGLVRVRYDGTNKPGFRVDLWTGAAYVEQGKMCVYRNGDTPGFCDTWVSAVVEDEWTPDRVTIQAVLAYSGDAYSRERVCITVERGTLGVTFEVYAALTLAGNPADVALLWTPALNAGVADLNNSILKIDAPGSPTTTVAAGSNGVDVSTFNGAGTLNVASTTGFAGGGGTLQVATALGAVTITYTATSGGTQFTGCSTVAGDVVGNTVATGGQVAQVTAATWAPGAAGQAVFQGTAGSGAGTGNSGMFGAIATLGNAGFTMSENWVALLRYPTVFNTIAAYQVSLVVLQAANVYFRYQGSSATAYGTNQDAYQVQSQNAAGYVQCQVQFSATQAQQVMEAESMTGSSGTSTVTDNPSPKASGAATNNSTVTTRTTVNGSHCTQANWPNGFFGTYRVSARVRVAAGTGSYRAKTGATTGATVTTTSTSYVWLDLGEIVANNTTLEIDAWNSGGGNNTYVDRIESVLVVDQVRTGALCSGARDAGQAALMDSRTLGALAVR